MTQRIAARVFLGGNMRASILICMRSGVLDHALRFNRIKRHNLISNAIKHNVDQGWIRASTTLRTEKD
jgi:hypothetical protein